MRHCNPFTNIKKKKKISRTFSIVILSLFLHVRVLFTTYRVITETVFTQMLRKKKKKKQHLKTVICIVALKRAFFTVWLSGVVVFRL